MVRNNRFFLAATQAVREDGFDPRLKAHIGAVITRGGSIISVATNSYGPDPYSLRYTSNEFLDSTHAEVNAIMQVRHKVDLAGTKMWVARLTKPLEEEHPQRDGLESYIALAMPCRSCKEIIARHNIKRVFYTIDEDTFATWRVPKIYVPRKHFP